MRRTSHTQTGAQEQGLSLIICCNAAAFRSGRRTAIGRSICACCPAAAIGAASGMGALFQFRNNARMLLGPPAP
jgi:hypothetical protein